MRNYHFDRTKHIVFLNSNEHNDNVPMISPQSPQLYPNYHVIIYICIDCVKLLIKLVYVFLTTTICFSSFVVIPHMTIKWIFVLQLFLAKFASYKIGFWIMHIINMAKYRPMRKFLQAIRACSFLSWGSTNEFSWENVFRPLLQMFLDFYFWTQLNRF